MTKIRVYTDGGCLPSKIGAAGFIAIRDSAENQSVFVKRADKYEDVTSNKMELQGMINATGFFVNVPEQDGDDQLMFEFCSDSSYVVKGINNNWYDMWAANDFKKANGYPVKNIEMWEKLMGFIDLLEERYKRVKFMWVRGKDSKGNGNGDVYNEMVDALVTKCLNDEESEEW